MALHPRSIPYQCWFLHLVVYHQGTSSHLWRCQKFQGHKVSWPCWKLHSIGKHMILIRRRVSSDYSNLLDWDRSHPTVLVHLGPYMVLWISSYLPWFHILVSQMPLWEGMDSQLKTQHPEHYSTTTHSSSVPRNSMTGLHDHSQERTHWLWSGTCKVSPLPAVGSGVMLCKWYHAPLRTGSVAHIYRAGSCPALSDCCLCRCIRMRTTHCSPRQIVTHI